MPREQEGQSAREPAVTDLHRHRQVAESFGADADRYDRARPGYPAALVERIVAASPGPCVMPGSPVLWAGPILDSYLKMCAAAADGIRQAATFGAPEQWRFAWDRTYTRDEWLDQVPTLGGHTLLPPPTLDDLLVGIGAAIDAAGGSFTMGYTTVAVTAALEANENPGTRERAATTRLLRQGIALGRFPFGLVRQPAEDGNDEHRDEGSGHRAGHVDPPRGEVGADDVWPE